MPNRGQTAFIVCECRLRTYSREPHVDTRVRIERHQRLVLRKAMHEAYFNEALYLRIVCKVSEMPREQRACEQTAAITGRWGSRCSP